MKTNNTQFRMALFAVTVLALSASSTGIAKASALTVTAEIGGVPTVSSATLEKFNEPAPPILTLSGSAWLPTGGNYYDYVPPYFSGSTAAFFGESPTNGFDSTQYVAVMLGSSATFNFLTPQHYFGLLWGSIGTTDCLTFYDSMNNVIGTVLGRDVPTVVPADWGPNGTGYVNITSTIAFSCVVATSPDSTFEFDDVAYSPTPEPATLLLLGLGGLILRKRKA